MLLPILRPAPDAGGGATPDAGDEGEDPDDDLSPQTVALRALKEIEFDRATGKLSDQDYDALKAKYTQEAVVAMRGEQPAKSASLLPAPPCPDHGARPERDAIFCSECGRRLAAAPGYCARCGTALESDARYCNVCGARIAA